MADIRRIRLLSGVGVRQASPPATFFDRLLQGSLSARRLAARNVWATVVLVDVVRIREQLVGDYSAFTSAFVEPRNKRINGLLDESDSKGRHWPEPWISMNPNFAAGGSVDDLVSAGLLHPSSAKVSSVKDSPVDSGPAAPIRFHEHQRKQIEVARTGESCVIATGMCSGKSEATEYVMSAFPIGNRTGPDLTPMLLREYDSMQRAVDAGIPPKSPLDSPPGHGPCHSVPETSHATSRQPTDDN